VSHRDPLCVLLLSRELERFILRDQVEDLLRAPNAVAVDPPRVPYGAFLRLPEAAAHAVAGRQARRLVRTLRHRGEPRAIVIFHPLQYPLARAMLALCPGSELWYGRWDRYERAYDASPAQRERLERLHRLAAGDSTVTASAELARLERAEQREAQVVTPAADSFPAPEPGAEVVALSLGHLGWRNDWALLREVAERLGDRLVLLLAGAWHEDECAGDPDFAACRSHPSLVWLGAQPDEAVARLLLAADVGVVPFKREPFNDAGLPTRILKYARLGRRTVSPRLAGSATWERAVRFADTPEQFADALLAEAGRRANPDLELREWALGQSARVVNGPLWERLDRLGIARDA
jgi:hypothetical protein